MAGVWGSEKETGKCICQDIYSRKLSFPIIVGLERGKGAFRGLIEKVADRANPLADELVAQIVDLMHRLEVKKACMADIERQTALAKESLEVANAGHGRDDFRFLSVLIDNFYRQAQLIGTAA